MGIQRSLLSFIAKCNNPVIVVTRANGQLGEVDFVTTLYVHLALTCCVLLHCFSSLVPSIDCWQHESTLLHWDDGDGLQPDCGEQPTSLCAQEKGRRQRCTREESLGRWPCHCRCTSGRTVRW